MIIQHNMISAYANQMLGRANRKINSSTEKLSSGYRINRAADDAACLAISEKMRGQIRGLNQAKENITDGINYVKTADGALNEITNIVQRMRELTVQALNDTNTSDDKEQIQLEISQLQHEIARISNQAEYNTIDIFDKHEPTYDSLIGKRKWDTDQAHTINKPNNTLEVKLSEEYNPSEITVEIPEGTYTTYELLETIEEDLDDKAPTGTSLLIEYYEGGTCNLTFEGGTEIQSVEGGLSYLFYDSYGGAGVGDLIGTTQFAEQYPLKIVTGKNDGLTFYVDKIDGSVPEKISFTLDEGEYTRSETIDAINTKLAALGYSDVKAIPYGDNNIKLSAGASLITGLKGNMFQIDEGKTVYDSVFYDNAKYGTITNTSGKITGKAYYNSNCEKINIDSANNKLRFGLEKDVDTAAGTGYIEITIPSKTGGYTITELRDVLNSQLAAVSASSKWEFTCVTGQYVSSGLPVSGNYDYLQLNSLVKGKESKIVIDMNDSVSKAAYETLFQKTTITSRTLPTIRTYGTDVYVKGRKTFDGEIDLQTAGKTLNISVDGGKTETLTLSKAKYNKLDDLLKDIQDQIDASSSLTGKVMAQKSDGENRIMLTSTDSTVKQITVSGGTAYSELFEAKEPNYFSYSSSTAYGTTEKQQGSTVITKTPAVVTLKYPMKTDDIVVDNTNNIFALTLNGTNRAITLKKGKYTRAQLIQEVNQQFHANGIGVTAKLNSQNKLEFSTIAAGAENSLYISTYSSNLATRVFMTPNMVTRYASSSVKTPAMIEGKTSIGSNFVIDSTNKDLVFTYKEKSGSTWKDTLVDISLTEKTYANTIDLLSELNKKIEEKLGKDKVTASFNTQSCIVLNTVGVGSSYGLTPAYKVPSDGTYGGGFYQNVLCKKAVQTKINTPINTSGTCVVGTTDIENPNVSVAYVVGRADLKNGTIEIKQNVNDVLTLDFTYPKADGTKQTITLDSIIPKGEYTGDEIVSILEESLNKQLQDKYGITNFKIKPEIGNINTGVVGANDKNALNFKLKWNKKETPMQGTYILDGVSGSAAYTVFYKTSGLPKPASITGTNDISNGVIITDKNNTFGFTVDGNDYDFTIPEGEYTSDEFIDLLNALFEGGDENGDIPKVEAGMENGCLKIEYATYGAHEITGIRGTGKDDLFFAKAGRQNKTAMRLQIGANAGQELALHQIPLSGALMKIDTIIVTKHSYAEFALKHLDHALHYINHQRSIYGAKNNRLEHAEQIAALGEENLQVSESKIRDTNMADEMMKHTKEVIIAEATQAMLAQANALYSDGVLRLLS